MSQNTKPKKGQADMIQLEIDIATVERLLAPESPPLSVPERVRMTGIATKLKAVRGIALAGSDRVFVNSVLVRLTRKETATDFRTPDCLRPENLPKKPPGGRAYVPGPSRFDRTRDE